MQGATNTDRSETVGSNPQPGLDVEIETWRVGKDSKPAGQRRGALSGPRLGVSLARIRLYTASQRVRSAATIGAGKAKWWAGPVYQLSAPAAAKVAFAVTCHIRHAALTRISGRSGKGRALALALVWNVGHSKYLPVPFHRRIAASRKRPWIHRRHSGGRVVAGIQSILQPTYLLQLHMVTGGKLPLSGNPLARQLGRFLLIVGEGRLNERVKRVSNPRTIGLLLKSLVQ